MILNSAPEHQATMSNVSQISNFAIKATAKSFHILSSGLYANKIRAIIRELSCNAYDSHIAAGKKEVPFDLHLPSQLEPHFSIRDYGVGLSHEQVTQIYTTYFESTKTNSNEFIGALGLGSKSPFSYTDNFTVTAIKDGSKRIYTAFINENGVPSIALMTDNDTDEPNGVEVKFSVNGYQDFSKFRQEACNVYTHFPLRPVISGVTGFEFHDIVYEKKDIIPGVHSTGRRNVSSVAVMGNISYPIDIPQASTVLGPLENLLRCGLEMHFDIGDLDFQASREGLSYIPQTISKIKQKLELLNESLVKVLAQEADIIPNLWDRALFLQDKLGHALWQSAAIKYANDTKLPTFSDNFSTGRAIFSLTVEELANDFNISLKVIQRRCYDASVKMIKPRNIQAQGNVPKNGPGQHITFETWDVNVDANCHFIVNDTKSGPLERIKYHYRQARQDRFVYIINAANKKKDIKITEFFAKIHNPPENRILKVSDLAVKPRNRSGTAMAKDVTIMSLEDRYTRRRNQSNKVWRDSGSLGSFDKKAKFYYIPVSGYKIESTKGYTDAKDLYEDIASFPGLFNETVYGVRKGDIEEVKKCKNWINLEEHIETLIKVKNTDFLLSMVKARLDSGTIFKYTNEVANNVNPKSPFVLMFNIFKDVKHFNGSTFNIERLFRKFDPTAITSPDTLLTKYQAEMNNVRRRYPLLEGVGLYRCKASDIAEYINLVDSKKGI